MQVWHGRWCDSWDWGSDFMEPLDEYVQGALATHNQQRSDPSPQKSLVAYFCRLHGHV